MTAQQLKKVTTFAGTFQIQSTHQRTGYFKHEVIIGGQPYTDSEQVIELLTKLHPQHVVQEAK